MTPDTETPPPEAAGGTTTACSVLHFLRRRHKIRGTGMRRFPLRWVWQELGIVSVQALPRLGFANAVA